MNQNKFVERCFEIISPAIIDKSGRVLYSTIDTLQRGDFYILGLNPGGTCGPSIESDINGLNKRKENAYLDEDWPPYLTGQHRLQRGLKFLFDELGFDLRKICASNLIFVRSRDARGAGYPENADACWPVHEVILNYVQPKIIIVFGDAQKLSPFAYLMKKHKENTGNVPEIEEIQSGHGNWKCKAFTAELLGLKITIIGIPHLSIYNIANHGEVIDWIKTKSPYKKPFAR